MLLFSYGIFWLLSFSFVSDFNFTTFLTRFRMNSFGMEDFAKKYGTLQPSQFVDVVSLVGDKSDNIPGSSMSLLLKFRAKKRHI